MIHKISKYFKNVYRKQVDKKLDKVFKYLYYISDELNSTERDEIALKEFIKRQEGCLEHSKRCLRLLRWDKEEALKDNSVHLSRNSHHSRRKHQNSPTTDSIQ